MIDSLYIGCFVIEMLNKTSRTSVSDDIFLVYTMIS
jgi:hypothetical protein